MAVARRIGQSSLSVNAGRNVELPMTDGRNMQSKFTLMQVCVLAFSFFNGESALFKIIIDTEENARNLAKKYAISSELEASADEAASCQKRRSIPKRSWPVDDVDDEAGCPKRRSVPRKPWPADVDLENAGKRPSKPLGVVSYA